MPMGRSPPPGKSIELQENRGSRANLPRALDTVSAEADRRYASLNELRHQLVCLDIRASSAAPLAGLNSWRIPEDVGACTRSTGIICDELEFAVSQKAGHLLRIADRRRTTDDSGAGTVVLADARESPHHVRDVCAEETGICVDLIQHDVFQPGHEALPLTVRRNQPRVDHFRVGD